MCVSVCVRVCALYLVPFDEGPEFAPAATAALPSGVEEAGLGHGPAHGQTVVLKLHVARGLKARLIRLHHLLRVLGGQAGRGLRTERQGEC